MSFASFSVPRARSRTLFVAVVSIGSALVPAAGSARNAFVKTSTISAPAPGGFAGGLRMAFDGQTLVAQSTAGSETVSNFYIRTSNGWSLQESITSPVSGPGPTPTPAISGDLAVIGVASETISGRVRQGLVRTFSKVGGAWVAGPNIQAQDGSQNDDFGAFVALHGTTLAIGAPGDDAIQGGPTSDGAVYLYELGTEGWELQAKITSPLYQGQKFGDSIAVRQNTVAVELSLGIAYIFERTGVQWTLTQTLKSTPGDDPAIPSYGISLLDHVLAMDVAGSSGNFGAVIFRRELDSWIREPVIAVPLRGTDTAFVDNGFAFDGEIMLKTAQTSVVGELAIYAYRRQPDGWFYDQRIRSPQEGLPVIAPPTLRDGLVLVGDEGVPCCAVHVFDDLPVGDSVLLGDSIRAASGGSGDGAGDAIASANGLLIIGAPEADAAGTGTGEAYVFGFGGPATKVGRETERRLAKAVQLLATLRPNSGSIGDKFGSGVAVTGDGQTIAIGSPEASGGEGEVAIFQAPPGGWTGTAVPEVTIPAPAPTKDIVPEGFGSALAFNESGVLTVGAPLTDRPGAANAGMAATFAPKENEYPTLPTQTLVATTSEANAGFGEEIAAADDVISISAPNQDRVGPLPDVGTVYTFRAAVSGSDYEPSTVLTPPGGGGIGDKFGRGLAIRSAVDASPTIVVGAPGIDTGTDQDTGRALVYADPGTGYVAVARLLTDGKPFDRAGSSIAITEDYVTIGAPEADRDGAVDTGSVYLYQRPPGGWLAAAASLAKSQGKAGLAIVDIPPKEELPAAEVQENQFFGAALSMSPSTAFVSAPSRDVQLANGGISQDQGEIDVYVLDEVFASGFE